ncbi:hypothetical protein DS745_03175 [Anaerobacillus alkaliphilus]|uniref:Uncharacterized protein n=1 Tax=Anaerobacillus alkaliphilus TaxID=1548597 RepID=A0A4Q0W1A9_9BACI|nr:hypothetical protein [Anaerobacillus alkaliphilus]RXJ04401.1 hypothetical protein DS745_03175 [Anaerobacillus alkaliphilus]
MTTIIWFLYEIFDLVLFVILLALLTFFLSLFFKKKKTLISAVAVVVVGTILLIVASQYTTFEKLVSNYINEETEIKDVTITILDPSSDRRTRIASVTIKDEEIIERILDDFSGLRLKRDRDARYYGREYEIRIFATNKTKRGDYLTTSYYLFVDEDYVNEYKIVNDVDHLKTLMELIEDEEIEWTTYDD